jgi:hypothetical protein
MSRRNGTLSIVHVCWISAGALKECRSNLYGPSGRPHAERRRGGSRVPRSEPHGELGCARKLDLELALCTVLLPDPRWLVIIAPVPPSTTSTDLGALDRRWFWISEAQDNFSGFFR